MTKEEAIYILRNTAWLGGNEQVKKVEEAIDTAERLIPNWIPCSERLPEENMRTICQNNAGAMMIGKYDIEFGWMFPAYFDGIIAWMPLPEPPYKENSDG